MDNPISAAADCSVGYLKKLVASEDNTSWQSRRIPEITYQVLVLGYKLQHRRMQHVTKFQGGLVNRAHINRADFMFIRLSIMMDPLMVRTADNMFEQCLVGKDAGCRNLRQAARRHLVTSASESPASAQPVSVQILSQIKTPKPPRPSPGPEQFPQRLLAIQIPAEIHDGPWGSNRITPPRQNIVGPFHDDYQSDH